MIDGWVHPGLVAGAALASVPILIHLLNRQRHKPMPWAAMRFVLAAYERTRRRARLEEWLLLLLREYCGCSRLVAARIETIEIAAKEQQ